MSDTAGLIAHVKQRMVSEAGERGPAVAGWFQRNESRLLKWVGLLQRTAQRVQVAGNDAASVVVDSIHARLLERDPGEAAWVDQYRPLLRLFVSESLAEISTAPPASVVAPVALVMPSSDQERMRINLAAVEIASRDQAPSESELSILRRYTGFGGLSLAKVKDRLPPDLVPTPKALIDEYYTPPELCAEVARLVSELSGGGIDGLALEPAAGVGRFVQAFAARPGMNVNWQVVEFSRLSARIAEKLLPGARVFNQSFESYLVEHFNELAGRLSLVVTNPPYGVRGRNKYEDPDKSYREDRAFAYFVRRSFDLLAGGGYGVALVPQGFLGGSGAKNQELRTRILRRHHLLVAFRLPSSLFVGAEIVTDLSVWQARGGELDQLDEADIPIAEGRYFELYPHHILGRETESQRGRYQVEGDFTGLPKTVTPRPICSVCSSIRPFITPIVAPADPRKSLDSELQIALGLAERVSKFLQLSGSTLETNQEIATEQHGELRAALEAWLNRQRLRFPDYRVLDDNKLRKAAKALPVFAALFSLFDQNGNIREEFTQAPRREAQYRGVATIGAHADWLYAKYRRLTVKMLADFRRELGYGDSREEIVKELERLHWCEDWNGEEAVWEPEDEYLSGDLWPKLERARNRSQVTQRIERQLQLLQDKVGSVTMLDAEPTLRDGWVPAKLTSQFLTDLFKLEETPSLEWKDGLFKPRGLPYEKITDLDPRLVVALGYINHDLGLFKPGFVVQPDPTTGEEETEGQARNRARVQYHETLTNLFRQWVQAEESRERSLLDAYGRRFRGYFPRHYKLEPLNIARWGNRVKLRNHQILGAWRLIRNNGGLLAFDVGVGKTLTGIAAFSYLRQVGRARRPIVIVPNSIIWKWYWEIKRALPDYAVCVIGSVRVEKEGRVTSRLDERAERLEKWTEFQLGLYDVALVTYSVFSRLEITEDDLRLLLEETPPLLREVGLNAAALTNELEKLTEKITERNKLAKQKQIAEAELNKLETGTKEYDKAQATFQRLVGKLDRIDKRIGRLHSMQDRLTAAMEPSERRAAIMAEATSEWIASQTLERENDGITFASLHCDCLIVDEAQNMKNLWTVGEREGGIPKYLGSINEASDRAFSFLAQAFLTQRETGGSGVILLSATPAKNSPLEFFTMLGFVDHYCWTRLGVYDADYYIDRYLNLELKSNLKPDGKIESRAAVTGFMNLPELRNIVFRYGDFKTATDVGLTLPTTVPVTEMLPMWDDQRQSYLRLRSEYEEIIRGKNAQRERHKALGILQRMGLVALHPKLESQPDDGWGWASAGKLGLQPAPKLVRAVELCKDRGGCGVIIFVDNVAVHRWLVDLLVEAGIDPKRIAVLNAERAKTPISRQQIAEGFNGVPAIIDAETGRIEQEAEPPIYDIVIANAVAYEGIDLQIRTCIVIHLDLPFEPATLQQRNGRAVRQGNMNSVVRVYYLLADKSYDAIKLQMIRGKLRWMNDILVGTERTTNNPAADMDLSVEDMLLMLADDPEAARLAMAEVKARQEAEQRKRASAAAWVRVASMVSLLRGAVKGREEDRERARKTAGEAESYLRQLSSDLWPWGFVVDLVKSRPTFAVPVMDNEQYTYRLIWDGLVLPLAEHRVVFGAIGSTAETWSSSFAWRRHGSHLWVRGSTDPSNWAVLASLSPDAFRNAEPIDDMTDAERSFVAAIEELPYRTDFAESLGLIPAPDEWSKMLWDRHGNAIVAALAKNWRAYYVPVRVADGVAFVPVKTADPATVIPPSPSGFAEMFRLIPLGVHSWAKVDEHVKAWWGRDFPRGFADDRPIIDLDIGRFRQVGKHGAILVVSLPESERIGLAHDPSRRYIKDAGEFADADRARVAARWLQSRGGTDGLDFAVDSRTRETLHWIAEQSEVPSMAGAQAHYDQE